MRTHEGWVELVDREDIVSFVAEGPYVRYGWPVHVTIRRAGERYQVSWFNEGDGASAPTSGQKDLDRTGLVRFLAELLPEGRPTQRTEG
jgi:hypothetical protein